MSEIVTEEIQTALTKLQDKRFESQISSILSYSEFASRIFAHYPGQINELIGSGDLIASYAENQLARKILEKTRTLDTQQEFERQLRVIRDIELVRVVWRELAGVAEIEESMRDLSSLADVLLDITTQKHLHWLGRRFGQPIDDNNGEIAGFAIFAMGKLGGKELNFSSDIDLIFAYSAIGQTNGENSISNNEFFIKLGQALINSLNNTTIDGFVYRVDMRLRPNGQSGPLVMSFPAMENYYQIHGREWERYAWIKARAVAGDKNLGEAFLTQLRPFIYRKYLDYQVYESLEQMKQMINKEIRQQGMQKNIKLGQGGIREIEFIVQSHQLVRGGREPELRTRSLRQALFALATGKYLNEDIAMHLYQAYLLLRTVEHRIQIKNDQQTHQLPERKEDFAELAQSFGLQVNEFEQRLNQARDFVHAEFTKLHRDKQTDHVDDDWQLLWQHVVADIQRDEVSSNSQLITPLKAYARSKAYRILESRGRKIVDRLLPKIARLTTATEQPTRSMNRVLEVISAIGGRSTYLSLLDQFPIACRQLVELCASSAWVSQWIAQHPIVLDILINPRIDQYIFNNRQFKEQISKRIKQEPDNELRHDILRQIHHSSMLQIAIADLQQQYKAAEIREFVSLTAEIIINQVAELCQQELQSRFGLPKAVGKVDYFGVIAYGKLGSRELSYNADLDLVFIYDDSKLEEQTVGGKKSVRIDYYFSRLVQRIITMLGMQTATGKLYDVDTRLRPSGQSGLLVSSLGQYEKYQLEQAWTWEHQALVKARIISDAPMLNKKFENIRERVLMTKRSQADLKKDIITMRERMRKTGQTENGFKAKTDFGGMIDIEFICQYLVLLNAKKYRELVRQRSVNGVIVAAEHNSLINKSDAELLSKTYMQLLELENHNKLHLKSSDFDSKNLKKLMQQTHRYWNRIFA